MSQAPLQRMAAEWKSNPRLRWGALVVLAILGTHALLSLGDARQARINAYGKDLELLARLEGMRRQDEWGPRAGQAQAALKAMTARIPEVPSAGLAQAEMQSWLSTLAGEISLAEPRIKVEPALEVPDYPEMWQVMARLEGQLPQYGQGPALKTLSEGLPWIQVERMELGEGSAPRMVIVVRSYFHRGPVLAGPTPASADPGAADLKGAR
jgi:hypothetical protein